MHATDTKRVARLIPTMNQYALGLSSTVTKGGPSKLSVAITTIHRGRTSPSVGSQKFTLTSCPRQPPEEAASSSVSVRRRYGRWLKMSWSQNLGLPLLFSLDHSWPCFGTYFSSSSHLIMCLVSFLEELLAVTRSPFGPTSVSPSNEEATR
jgi:hypothetical protein